MFDILTLSCHDARSRTVFICQLVIVEVFGPLNNNRTFDKYTEFVNILHKD